jgi:hypothetical protein
MTHIRFTISALKPDLEDNQKRWLIVGICLQNIISPTLRTYTEPIIINIYKQCVGIDRQSYPNQRERYGTTYKLNYEAINNNNKIIPKHQKSMYDYKVRNHVDFSKLFLATNMAIYTAFDETVDISALLGMIINIDTFPQNVRNIADQVRYYYYIHLYIHVYTKMTGETISNLKIGSQIQPENRKIRIKIPPVHVYDYSLSWLATGIVKKVVWGLS